MQQIVSCASEAVLVGRGYRPDGKPSVMSFVRREDNVLVEIPVPIGRRPHLLLSLRHLYAVAPHLNEAGRTEWRVDTVSSSYELLDPDERQVIAYHWHPGTPPAFPHLHFGRQFAHPDLPAAVGARAAALVRAHLPTRGRVSLATVLRLAITELGVEPIRPDWEAVLARADDDAGDVEAAR